ncbi:tubulin epsilon and delta complex protein 2 isoform 2-T2 [Thomomys bottae]
MLPADSARRLAAELQGALDACSERQRQLEQSLRVSRRLLRAWEGAGTSAHDPPPRPESKEADASPEHTPTPQELKELELLTQALEKAARVRKGVSKARERDRQCGSIAAAPPPASGQAGNRVPMPRPTKGIRQTPVQAKEQPGVKLLSVSDRKHVGIEVQATKYGPRLQDQQSAPYAPPVATEGFTLKQKGTLLRLPAAFRKAASQNARLWAQLNSTQTSDSTEATRAAKIQFLQKMQADGPSPRPSAAEVEAEAQRLRELCALLRLHMQEAVSTAPADWMQEYRCLLTLEGLQAMVEQCLQRLKHLQAATEQAPEPPSGKPLQMLPPWRGDVGPSQSPQLLLYSSTQELQTLAALELQVAMLDQQIHLEKVLMAELLPLVNTQQPQGTTWLALCRAVHSLLCEGAERFLTVLHDEPAD